MKTKQPKLTNTHVLKAMKDLDRIATALEKMLEMGTTTASAMEHNLSHLGVVVARQQGNGR
jgi:hypothetical protein